MKKLYSLYLCIAVAMFSFVGTANAEVTPATLPFSFDGGKANVVDNVGVSHSGLGSDYKSSPYLKFDDTDDWMVIQVTDVIGELKFAKKGNSTNTECKFYIQTSVDGVVYNDFCDVPPTGSATGENRITVDNFPTNVRYIRFYYKNKAEGNFAIGDIDITKGDANSPSISVVPTSIDFGDVDLNATAEAKTITLTAANLTKDVTVSFVNTENNPFSSSVTEIVAADAVTDNINISLNTATAGDYTNTLKFTHDGTVLAQVALSAKVVVPLPDNAIIETFDNYPETAGSYKDSSFVGINNITWTYTNCRGDKDITGNAPTLRDVTTSNIVSSNISGGCGIIRLNYMQAFSNTANFKILINGVEKGPFTTTTKNEILNTGDIEVNVEGDFTIKIEQNSGGAQVTIDDIVWTPYIPTSIEEAEAAKVYATLGAINIVGAEMADVTIVDMAGRVVAAQVVESNACISVESGIYIVKVNNTITKVMVR